MEATLRTRDWSEFGAGLFVCAMQARFWWKIGAAGWPMAFAILLALTVSLFFVRERLRARALRLRPDAPLLDKIAADLAEMRHQRRLLNRVALWYLAPLGVAMLIQGGVIVSRTPAWDPLRQPVLQLGFGLFFVLIFGLIWAANRRTVRQRIEPRIAELEKLHRDLLGPA
ncbi:MAG: hypothetical protein WDM96_01150 [Lacunisphaera sp.]